MKRFYEISKAKTYALNAVKKYLEPEPFKDHQELYIVWDNQERLYEVMNNRAIDNYDIPDSAIEMAICGYIGDDGHHHSCVM